MGKKISKENPQVWESQRESQRESQWASGGFWHLRGGFWHLRVIPCSHPAVL